MRALLLLMLPLWTSLGCAEWLPTSAGVDDTTTAASNDTTPAPSIDTSPAAPPTTQSIGPRVVTLMNGETTLATPIGVDMGGPGAILVQPINGDPPQLGIPVD